MRNGPRRVSVALALAFAALAVVVRGRDPLPAETWLLERVRVSPSSGAAEAWLTVSDVTGSVPVVGVGTAGAAVLLVAGRRADAALLFCAVLAVAAGNPLLKHLVGRERPGPVSLLPEASIYSFPSGHAATSAALVLGCLALLVPRLTARARAGAAVVGALVLLAVAAAQLALGRHYPTDLLAGWLLAGAWVALLWSLRGRVEDSRS